LSLFGFLMGVPGMKRLCWLVTVLPFLISFSQVHAQPIGDTQNGLAWAQQVCSECHAKIGQTRAVIESPPSECGYHINLSQAQR
jgi:hypothetical protein